jgi:Flp pilus assembly protein TadG
MTIVFSRLKAFGSGSAGSAAVEFALVAPLLFLLLFAAVEFGRAWWAKSSLQYAAERAARYAVVCGAGACPSVSQIQNYAATQVYDQTVASSAFTITNPTAGTTCVNFNFNFAPWFVGDLAVLESTLTFTGTACRAHT